MPKREAAPYVAPTDDELWERALTWARSGHEGPFHSRTPHEAPDGFVRLQYLDAGGDSPPSFIYLKPASITHLVERPVGEPGPLWNGGPLGRDGPYISGKWGSAKITPESVTILHGLGKKTAAAPVEQGSLF
jgi:hypothetical protein